jgi:hypothetical protein
MLSQKYQRPDSLRKMFFASICPLDCAESAILGTAVKRVEHSAWPHDKESARPHRRDRQVKAPRLLHILGVARQQSL